MLRLRHLVIQPLEEDVAPLDECYDLVGHLALEGGVADLLYKRFGARFPEQGFLALQGAKPIGVCGWRQDEGFGFLGPLVVCPEKRSWGLGGTLIDRVLQRVRVEGVRSIESAYPSGDPVCSKLFARNGFRELGEERNEDDVSWTRVERLLKKN